MTETSLIQYGTWLMFALIFWRVLRNAIHQRTRSAIHIALFFGAPSLVFLMAALARLGLLPQTRVLTTLELVLVLSLGYWVMRLVADFMPTRPWVLWVTTATFGILSGIMIVGPSPPPPWFFLLAISWFVSVQLYAAIAFFHATHRSVGVTRRRMQAVTLGSGFLGCAMLVLGVQGVVPNIALLGQVLALLAAISYYLGFAPPDILRRAWQEPDLRAFLGQAAALRRLPSTHAILESIAEGVATALGVPHATIGLWDETAQVLRFPLDPTRPAAPLGADLPALQVFRTQQALFIPAFVDPVRPPDPSAHQAAAVVAAPITAGDQRLGVLVVTTTNAPIFADEDSALLSLLADHAAVILESHALIADAARVQAREQLMRVKDDFLAAAAHDLKTPLTTLVARSQLLERRIMRSPTTPIALDAVRPLVHEAQRLQHLVQDLLDSGRAEQGQLVGARHPVNLVALAERVSRRHDSDRHLCTVTAPTAVIATVDEQRIEQLLENLVENAVKYSPDGGAIALRLWQTDEHSYLTVADHGIGIPHADRAHVFERFQRGNMGSERHLAGMGLGLYLCHAIVTQHGGQITISDTRPQGTTFQIHLPREPEGGLPREPADPLGD